MNYKTWMGILLISTALALPFVTSAKPKYQGKRQANGTIVCECLGSPNCSCDPNWKPQEPKTHIAECGFSRPIRVATTSNNRPFGWAEWYRTISGNTLESRGFGIEMFEEIAQKLKLRYQVFGYTSDQEAINAIKKGELDLLIGVYTPNSTVGRGSVTVFPAIFTNVFAVYFPKDRTFDVYGYKSLANKKGVLRRTENIYPLFSQHVTDDMSISLETTEDAFKKLLTGEADYLIGSPYSIEAELRRYKLHDRIVSADKGIFSGTMFMVLTRATDCFKLRDMLGEAVESYTSDSNKVDKAIRKVIDEWGERFRDAPALKIPESMETTDNAESTAKD